MYKQLQQMSISSYANCFHYASLLLFNLIPLTSVMLLYHTLSSPLSYICFPVFSSPRSFWVIWLPFHLDNSHDPVSAPSRRAHLIHISRGPAAQPGRGSPVPLLSATDPQWFHLYLLCLTVHRLLLLLWNDASWIMLGYTEENKSQHLDDHCFTATNHRIKE